MKVTASSENFIELNLTDEELSLVTSTNIGMKFWVSGKVITQNELLDLRLKLSNELQAKKQELKRQAICAEIDCVDFLLSLRTYLEETSPESLMLTENSIDNYPTKH